MAVGTSIPFQGMIATKIDSFITKEDYFDVLANYCKA